MTRGYLVVGHGGPGPDPGAVNRRLGLVEHELAHLVVDACADGLARAGEDDLVVEHDGRTGHDPGLSESIRRANASGASWGIEVHFNAGGGHGSESWIYARGGSGEEMAIEIQRALKRALGTPDRGVKVNPSFGWVRETRFPAVLVEVEFVDGPAASQIARDPELFCTEAGEAIARALLDWRGIRYIEPGGGEMTEAEMRELKQFIKRQVQSAARQTVQSIAWGHNKRGGIFPDDPAESSAARRIEKFNMRALARAIISAMPEGTPPADAQVVEAVKQALREGTE